MSHSHPDVVLVLDSLTVHQRVDGRHAVELLQKLDLSVAQCPWEVRASLRQYNMSCGLLRNVRLGIKSGASQVADGQPGTPMAGAPPTLSEYVKT